MEIKTGKFSFIKFTDQQRKDIDAYLSGEIVSRELGKRLGVSHQQAINLVAQYAKYLYHKLFKKT